MSFAHLRGQQARGHVSLNSVDSLVLAQLHSEGDWPVDQMGVNLPDLTERKVQ